MSNPLILKWLTADVAAAKMEEAIAATDANHRRWLAQKAAAASAVRPEAAAPVAWPTPRPPRPPRNIWHAIHEGSHVVCAFALAGPSCLHSVSIDDVPICFTDDTHMSLADRIVVSAAGAIGELAYFTSLPECLRGDNTLGNLVTERGRTETLVGCSIGEDVWFEAQSRAADVLAQHGDALEAIVKGLMSKGTLVKSDLVAILGA